MRNTIHLEKVDGLAAAIVRSAYPEYRGRKVELEIGDYPIDVRSYWEGGSRDYFVFVNLATMERVSVPQQSAFDRPIEGADRVTLPDGFACVRHTIFCGKDCGITILIGASNAAPLLPMQGAESLSAEQTLVLRYTSGRKSSYAGRDRCQMAQEDMGYAHRVNSEKPAPITREAWNLATESLIVSGHLAKNKAITAKGRNAIANEPLI